jgi:hypothetical protein
MRLDMPTSCAAAPSRPVIARYAVRFAVSRATGARDVVARPDARAFADARACAAPVAAADEHRHEHSDFFAGIRRRRSRWTGRRSIVTASADEFDRDRDTTTMRTTTGNYRASHDDYRESIFPNGLPFGTARTPSIWPAASTSLTASPGRTSDPRRTNDRNQ